MSEAYVNTPRPTIGRLVFGQDRICPHCTGRGWMARVSGNGGPVMRPAYPSELRDHASGKAPHNAISPCRTCEATGLIRNGR